MDPSLWQSFLSMFGSGTPGSGADAAGSAVAAGLSGAGGGGLSAPSAMPGSALHDAGQLMARSPGLSLDAPDLPEVPENLVGKIRDSKGNPVWHPAYAGGTGAPYGMGTVPSPPTAEADPAANGLSMKNLAALSPVFKGLLGNSSGGNKNDFPVVNAPNGGLGGQGGHLESSLPTLAGLSLPGAALRQRLGGAGAIK